MKSKSWKKLFLPEIKTRSEKNIIVIGEKTIVRRKTREDLKNDYDSVRETYHELVVKGKDSLDGLMDVAAQSESARAYEVVAETIRTIADTNEKIIDLHKKSVDIEKRKNEIENEKDDLLGRVQVFPKGCIIKIETLSVGLMI